MSQLQGMDPKCGPARMLCCIQLHFRAFFVDVPNANALAVAMAVPVLQFQACHCDVMVGNMSWLSMLPQHHCSVTLPKFLDPKMEPKQDGSNSKKKSAQVCNLNVSLCFEEFKIGITSHKFNEIIKKVGPPPQ